MKWVTRECVHFDRVISAWLIKRFVDSDAEFSFVPWGRENERPADAMAFAIPGVALSDHDEHGSTFEKIMRKYGLEDPVLRVVQATVSYGVKYVLYDEKPAPSEHAGEIVPGFMTLAEGIMFACRSDAEVIDRSLFVYDALYASCQARRAMGSCGGQHPTGHMGPGMWQTTFNAALLTDLRSRDRVLGPGFSVETTAEFVPSLARLRQGVAA